MDLVDSHTKSRLGGPENKHIALRGECGRQIPDAQVYSAGLAQLSNKKTYAMFDHQIPLHAFHGPARDTRHISTNPVIQLRIAQCCHAAPWLAQSLLGQASVRRTFVKLTWC